MKKLTLLLAAVLLAVLAVGPAGAEHWHIRLECTQESLGSEWDIYTGEETVAVSSTTPEYAIEYSGFGNTAGDTDQWLAALLPESKALARLAQFADRATAGAAEEKGFYTGDCFDLALTKKEAVTDGAALGGSRLGQWLAAAGMSLRCQVYDGGKYYTFQGEKDGAAYFTFSLNRTDADNTSGVLSFAESGRIYGIGFQALADNDMTFYSISLSVDPEQAGYQNASLNHSFLHWEGIFRHEGEQNPILFDGALSSANERIEMRMAGEIMPAGASDSSRMEITNARTGETWGILTVTRDEAAFSPENKIIVRADDDRDPSGKLLMVNYEHYFTILLGSMMYP